MKTLFLFQVWRRFILVPEIKETSLHLQVNLITLRSESISRCYFEKKNRLIWWFLNNAFRVFDELPFHYSLLNSINWMRFFFKVDLSLHLIVSLFPVVSWNFIWNWESYCLCLLVLSIPHIPLHILLRWENSISFHFHI